MDTCNNPKGIFALNTDSEECVLATPGIQLGTVRVSLYGSKNKNYIFNAHETAIEHLALSPDGSVLAVTSFKDNKATSIKFFEINLKDEPA